VLWTKEKIPLLSKKNLEKQNQIRENENHYAKLVFEEILFFFLVVQ
jgi:hypothetical protein